MPQTAVQDDPARALLSAWLWPLNVMKAWAPLVSLAPQVLTQPILPNLTLGDVYNVTADNSSAPQTEREVVSRHSYGRQLGRITDALAVVVGSLEQDKLSPQDRERLEDFAELAKSIEQIKSREAMKRMERVAEELRHLKKARPADYDRAVTLLEPLLRG